MTTAQKRRAIPIIDSRFQWKYTLIILGVAAFISMALGYFLYKSYAEMNDILAIAATIPEISDRLQASDRRFVYVLTGCFLVGEVFLLGVLGLVITHRVAGPMFVMHRHFTDLLSGVYPKTRPLRKDDEFKETFELMRRTVETFRQRDMDDSEKLKAAIAAGEQKGLSVEDLAPLKAMLAERTQRIG